MPKSVKKSCTTQTSISRYFGGLSSSSASNTQSGIKQNPAQLKVSRGKVRSLNTPHTHIHTCSGKITNAIHWTLTCFVLQKKPSPDGAFGLPSKRAKLSVQEQQVEDLDCEPASCQSTKGERTENPPFTFQPSRVSHGLNRFLPTSFQTACAVMLNYIPHLFIFSFFCSLFFFYSLIMFFFHLFLFSHIEKGYMYGWNDW